MELYSTLLPKALNRTELTKKKDIMILELTELGDLMYEISHTRVTLDSDLFSLKSKFSRASMKAKRVTTRATGLCQDAMDIDLDLLTDMAQ